MTLACLASQFCTELGPAQPQLVSHNIYLPYRNLQSDHTLQINYFPNLLFGTQEIPNGLTDLELKIVANMLEKSKLRDFFDHNNL